MALELASRAQGVSPRMGALGAIIAGDRVPSTLENTIAVAFSGGSNDIPSYSLADLRACLEKGDKDFFRRQSPTRSSSLDRMSRTQIESLPPNASLIRRFLRMSSAALRRRRQKSRNSVR
jgi:hypothetical protein